VGATNNFLVSVTVIAHYSVIAWHTYWGNKHFRCSLNLSFVSGPIFYLWAFCKPQDLKVKYNAKWALVTGGSSGLGKALVEKLANQGLNIVIAAFPDDILKATHAEMVAKFPKLQFRAVPVNFGVQDDTYMNAIIEATKDIDVQIVFSNAGYLLLKGIVKAPLTSWLSNVECNSTSHMRITHHFASKMVEKKLRGCFVYTSSTMSFFFSPGNAMYSATKAFLVAMAQNLAVELDTYGIDVTVVNCGPMATPFFDKNKVIDSMKPFLLLRSTPQQVADVMLGSVGRVVVRDHAILNVIFRMMAKITDPNWLIRAFQILKPYTSDAKNHPDLF
jgi:short-subunit dehydrogenase